MEIEKLIQRLKTPKPNVMQIEHGLIFICQKLLADGRISYSEEVLDGFEWKGFEWTMPAPRFRLIAKALLRAGYVKESTVFLGTAGRPPVAYEIANKKKIEEIANYG